MGRYIRQYTEENNFYEKVSLFFEENGFGESDYEEYGRFYCILAKEIAIKGINYKLTAFVHPRDCIEISCRPLILNTKDNLLSGISFIIDLTISNHQNSFELLNDLMSKIDIAIPFVTSQVNAQFKNIKAINLWSVSNCPNSLFKSFDSDLVKDYVFDLSNI